MQKLLIKNDVLQAVFFCPRYLKLQEKISHTSKFTYLTIVKDSFTGNSEFVFKEKVTWSRVLWRLTSLLDESLHRLFPRPWIDKTTLPTPNYREEYAAVFMINQIFELLMENNKDNLEERAFDVELQEYYGKVVKDHVIGMINDLDHDILESYSPIFLVKDFEVIIKEIIENRGEPDKQDLEFMKLDVVFSFLNLMNESLKKWIYINPTFVFGEIFTLFSFKNEDLLEVSEEGNEKDKDKKIEEAEDYCIWDIRFKDIEAGGLYFLAEFLKLYTNVCIFEYPQTVTEDPTIKKKLDDLQMRGQQIRAIVNSVGNLNIEGANADAKKFDEYSYFVVKGLIRLLYKYFMGLYLEISSKYYE